MTPPKLYALRLKSQYLHDKAAANIGRKLIQQEAKVINKVSMSTALAILIAGKMTKRMYIDIRLLLKTMVMTSFQFMINLTNIERKKDHHLKNCKILIKELNLIIKKH